MYRVAIGLLVWGVALYGALGIASSPDNWLPGNWRHALCGPWGCGPPLQAVIGCHLAWLVGLLPIASSIRRRGGFAGLGRRSLAVGLAAIAVSAFFSLCFVEYTTWFAQAAPSQQRFLFHRCTFAVATAVELPIVELLICAVWLRIGKAAPLQMEVDPDASP